MWKQHEVVILLTKKGQHLYILSSEEIKEGDWYMYCHFGEWIISNSRETLKNETNTLENLNKDDYFKKIIATTDFELRTPDSGIFQWCNYLHSSYNTNKFSAFHYFNIGRWSTYDFVCAYAEVIMSGPTLPNLKYNLVVRC